MHPSGPRCPASDPAIPDRSSRRTARPHLWKDQIMAAKPKPQPSEDAREQARRALQTSLDTRQ